MTAELLLEIGTEEIPSGYINQALQEVVRLSRARLKENRIETDVELYAHATPRRLVLIGKGIPEKQEDLVKEITGPPKRVAYDDQGEPTKAALGFAQKVGIPVTDLDCIETPKGEYLFAKTTDPGRPAIKILAELLPRLVADIPWPKSMRWGALGVPFVRPIHWVVALLNGKVIPFEFAGVKSGNQTRGHRFMAPDSQVVSDVEDFLKKMADGFVLIDQQKRQEAVIRVTRKAAAAVGAQPAEDPELVTTVTHLVEYPSAVCGSFDSDFLNLPDPVLITAMKEHQKYFALYDNERRLMPNFIAVNNTVATDEAVVRKGHERVLRARLSDASFFFKEDQRRALKERLEDLKGVIYQTDLGTSFAKVMRFTRLADYVGRMVIPDQLDDVRLAATLCKCDLVTQMVTEFPSLQGTMGMEYARIEGYPEPICLAIREHYLPVRAGDQIPTGPLGAVVGVADRMDTIVGCFAVGLEPSGSADPFALRRHALAILRIMEHTGWQVSLSEMVQYAISVLQEEIGLETGPLFHGVMEFFRERYKQSMLRAGYESGLIEAVISVGFDRINELRARIENLRGFVAESPEFEPLALTAKRVTNILKAEKEALEVDPVLFKDPCETALWSAYGDLKAELYSCLQKGSHDRALEILCKFRKPVDDFFEGVEILTKKDEALRANRLGLLQHLQKLFLSVADFSKFSI